MLPESVIVYWMAALFSTGRKLSVIVLIACGMAQFSCPLLWSIPESEKIAVVKHGCHENHQEPAPEHNKCCIASHSQQADVAVRYSAPELIDNPESPAADLSATSITKELFTRNLYPALRYPGSILRI
ncbi:MAG: hypothetical protein DMG65_07435 [Candidatus Angelobacter sp. Gp1-AA117]|nr:MAG: hypothetical protein DMG65_07435 [Candidatus Angelobacter sp. Gp1-AA117]